MSFLAIIVVFSIIYAVGMFKYLFYLFIDGPNFLELQLAAGSLGYSLFPEETVSCFVQFVHPSFLEKPVGFVD